MNKLQLNRILPTLLLITFSTSIGCSTWRPTPATHIRPDDAAALEGKRVKFYTVDGVQTMKVNRVEFPYVYGTSPIELRIDLRKVYRMETLGFSIAKTLRSVALVSVVILSIVAIAGFIAWVTLD